MKFYFFLFLFIFNFLPNIQAAEDILIRNNLVEENKFNEFLYNNKYVSLVSYLTNNLDYFDISNDEIIALESIKERNKKQYLLELRSFLELSLLKPLTEKNYSFLCQANKELDFSNEFLNHSCTQEHVTLANSKNEKFLNNFDAYFNEIQKNGSFIILQNGHKLEFFSNQLLHVGSFQWVYFNNSHTPFVFFGNQEEFLLNLLKHLDSKENYISLGECHNQIIKDSILNNLKLNILYKDSCISKNFVHFDNNISKFNQGVNTPNNEQINFSKKPIYYGLGIIALALLFSKNEVILEY